MVRCAVIENESVAGWCDAVVTLRLLVFVFSVAARPMFYSLLFSLSQ